MSQTRKHSPLPLIIPVAMLLVVGSVIYFENRGKDEAAQNAQTGQGTA